MRKACMWLAALAARLARRASRVAVVAVVTIGAVFGISGAARAAETPEFTSGLGVVTISSTNALSVLMQYVDEALTIGLTVLFVVVAIKVFRKVLGASGA